MIHLAFKYVKENFFLIFIILYHFIITSFAYAFAMNNKADANVYWFRTQNPENFIRHSYVPLRENLLYYINYFLAIQLNLPFWFGFLIYSSIGLVGILLIVQLITKISPKTQIHFLYLGLLLLPSMHFWTGMMGKEPICFLALVLVFFGLVNKKLNLGFILSGFLLLAVIRPQMAAILAFAVVVAFVIHQRKIATKYIIFLALLAVIVVIGLTQASWFTSFSLDKIQAYIDVHHRVLQQTDTYVPLENYNWFYKFFTFYFRPFPGEIPSLLGWLQGVENMFVLVVAIFGLFALFNNIRNYNYKITLLETSIILFFILTAVVLSLAYSNFGLISRMKNMSMPFMLMIFIHWILIYLNPNIYAQEKIN